MESRLAQSRACSCSFSAPHRAHQAPHTISLYTPEPSQLSHRRQAPARLSASERRTRASSSQSDPKPRQKISGYTPANFVSYSGQAEERCHHLIAVEVDAPASICFSIWNDWNRLVDFMDLVSQIGLDPSQPDMALFQCFYRWGMLPVLEIVFLLRKTNVEQDKLIEFETIHGMPASGQVEFLEADGKTTVLFKLEHQLPNLLVDLDVRRLGVEANCRDIFTENFATFKKLAEGMARNPDAVEPRKEAEDRALEYGLDVTDEELEEERREKEEEAQQRAMEEEQEWEELEAQEELEQQGSRSSQAQDTESQEEAPPVRSAAATRASTATKTSAPAKGRGRSKAQGKASAEGMVGGRNR